MGPEQQQVQIASVHAPEAGLAAGDGLSAEVLEPKDVVADCADESGQAVPFCFEPASDAAQENLHVDILPGSPARPASCFGTETSVGR